MTARDGSDVTEVRRSWVRDEQKLTLEWGEKQADTLWDNLYAKWDPVIDGQDVLDIGCHWGFLLRFLGERFRPRRLIGIDLVPNWDTVVHGWDWRADDRVEFHRTDALGLDLPPGSLDLVLCSSVFQYLSPELLDRTLARVRELLRPGGRFLLRTQVYTSYLGASLHRDYELPYVHMLHGQQLLADRLRAGTGRQAQYTNWLTSTSYLTAFARAGFEILDTVRMMNFLEPQVVQRVAREYPVAEEEINCTGLEAHLIKQIEPGQLHSSDDIRRKGLK